MAAMVAYNLMLALFPFALLLLFIAGQLLQSGDVQATILRDLQELFPSTEQDTLESTLDRVRDSSTEIGIVAIVAGLWIGASFWGAMDTAFCRIYHVECRGWLEQKRFSLIMLVVVALFLTASVAVPAAREPRRLRRRGPPVRARRDRLARQRAADRRRPRAHLPDPLPDLLGRPEGPPALARGLAGRAVHDGRGRHRQRRSSRSTSSNISGIGDFGRIVSFVLVPLLWFYALSLGLLAGAVINALRFELHDTGTLRGMTADFEAPQTERIERIDAA